METFKDLPAIEAKDAATWRKWLEANHEKTPAVWLIMYKMAVDKPSVCYNEALDEAICFGWIDSHKRKRDEHSFYQLFSKRKVKSKWSRVNKEKVRQLTKAGKMMSAGLEAVKAAKANGMWDVLNEVEEGVVPPDLQAALDANPIAKGYFEAFPRSSKRNILEWILSAKQAETRQKRIDETVRMAAENLRANHYRQPKS